MVDLGQFLVATLIVLVACVNDVHGFQQPFPTTKLRLAVSDVVGGDYIQYSLVKFWTKDSSGNFEEISQSDISCAWIAKKPVAEWSNFERAEKACDGNLDTKMLAHFSNNGGSNPKRSRWNEVEFTLSSSKTVYKYAICTGNDAAERRPKEWALSAKIDLSSDQAQLGDWFLLDSQLDGALPTSFKTCKEFSVTYEKEAYRLHILETRNAAADLNVQIGEIDWFANGVANAKNVPT